MIIGRIWSSTWRRGLSLFRKNRLRPLPVWSERRDSSNGASVIAHHVIGTRTVADVIDGQRRLAPGEHQTRGSFEPRARMSRSIPGALQPQNDCRSERNFAGRSSS